jgi:putative FmdB family regulatory protein
MPLYEYECEACGHLFEKIRKFSDPPVETCPKCGGTVHKMQSAPAFHLKGTGWYVTDYAKKDQAAPEKKTDSGSQETKKDDTTKTKPESPSDSKSQKAEKTEKTEKTEKAEKKEKTTLKAEPS